MAAETMFDFVGHFVGIHAQKNATGVNNMYDIYFALHTI